MTAGGIATDGEFAAAGGGDDASRELVPLGLTQSSATLREAESHAVRGWLAHRAVRSNSGVLHVVAMLFEALLLDRECAEWEVGTDQAHGDATAGSAAGACS